MRPLTCIHIVRYILFPQLSAIYLAGFIFGLMPPGNCLWSFRKTKALRMHLTFEYPKQTRSRYFAWRRKGSRHGVNRRARVVAVVVVMSVTPANTAYSHVIVRFKGQSKWTSKKKPRFTCEHNNTVYYYRSTSMIRGVKETGNLKRTVRSFRFDNREYLSRDASTLVRRVYDTRIIIIITTTVITILTI